MSQQPNISVIIPSYNRADILHETLDSLVHQTSKNWEALVVDDGSTDDSLAIARNYARQDSRFRVIERKRTPKGAGMCRNIGLAHARSPYILFLDSDDLLAPHCIADRTRLANTLPSEDFLVFQIASFTLSSDQLEYFWNIESGEPDTTRFMKLDAVWQTSSVLWKKEFLESLEGFDPALACWQDVDIHLRALLAEGVRYKKFLDRAPDVYYRRHSLNSISQQSLRTLDKLNSRKQIIQKFSRLLSQRGFEGKALRQMAFHVILSAAGSPHIKIAFSTLKFAYAHQVITTRDVGILTKAILFQWTRLVYFPPVQASLKRITRAHHTESLVCKIPLNQI